MKKNKDIPFAVLVVAMIICSILFALIIRWDLFSVTAKYSRDFLDIQRVSWLEHGWNYELMPVIWALIVATVVTITLCRKYDKGLAIRNMVLSSLVIPIGTTIFHPIILVATIIVSAVIKMALCIIGLVVILAIGVGTGSEIAATNTIGFFEKVFHPLGGLLNALPDIVLIGLILLVLMFATTDKRIAETI